jgi:hypothetical protein
MGFDRTYDQMLRNEFGPGGRDAADAAPAPADAGRAPGLSPSSIALDAPVVSEVATVVPALALGQDAPPPRAVHSVFRANEIRAAEDVPSDAEGPRGLSRYRNAAMVGAGGLTCAAIGAFLGGLGGYFTVNPAVAHPLASSPGSNQPLATAVDQAYRVASHGDSADGALVSFSSPSGSLAQSTDPLQWLTTSGSNNLAVSDAPATVLNLPGLGSGSGGLGLGCATPSDLGVGCLLGSVTTVLGTIGSGSSDPTAVVDELLPSLSGVVSDITGTLSDLGALLPIGSLPTAGLPTAVLEELGLGSGAGSGLGSLGSLGSSLGSLGSIGAGGAGSVPGSTAGALDPALNGILAAAGATTSSAAGSVSSAGGPSSGHSGLPVTAPSGSVSSAASGRSTTTTSSSTTTTTSPSGRGSSGTTVTVPLPGLPVPSTPPVSVGGVSVGVNSGSSGSGLSLSLP